MRLLGLCDISEEKVKDFLKKQWGSTEMVISSGVFDCSKLDGFAVLNDNAQITGLITYYMTEKECEIISLDSLEEKKGIGTLLVARVEEEALENKCTHVKLITTNDNLLAMRFYQKRGYYLAELLKNAVETARKIKPQIPFTGYDDIPIRDEMVLEKLLNNVRHNSTI